MIGKYFNGLVTLEIYQDDGLESPREWDNLGKICSLDLDYNESDIEIVGRKNEDEAAFDKVGAVYLPLYKYEHSGVALNTTGFSCPWDSGQIGYIYATKEDIRKEYSVKRISKKTKQKVFKVLDSEIKTYSQWLSGDVYSYFTKDQNGNIIDSCGGFYGVESILEEFAGHGFKEIS